MRLQYPLMLDGAQPVAEALALLQDPEGARDAGDIVLLRFMERLRVRWRVAPRDALAKWLQDAAAEATLGSLTATGRTDGPWYDATALTFTSDGELSPIVPGWLVVYSGSRYVGVLPPMPMAGPPGSDEEPDMAPPPTAPTRGGGAAPSRGPNRGQHAEPPAAAAPPSSGATPDAVGSDGDAATQGPETDTLLAIARVDAPTRIAPSRTASGTLTIGLAPAPSPTAPDVMRFSSAPSVMQLTIDVMVEAPDFTCDAGWKYALQVPKADPFTPSVVLTLVPLRPDDETPRTSTVRVHYSYRGQPAGLVTRTIALGLVSSAEVATLAKPVTPALSIAPSDTPIDLTIRIARRDDSESARELIWTMLDCAIPSVTLPSAPFVQKVGDRDNASSFASKVTSQVNTADGSVTVDNMLCGIGTLIRRAIPAEVLATLKAVHAAVAPARLPRVLLLTDECHVPWELAYLDDAPDPARAPFLGAQYAVSRWIHGDVDIPVPPPATLRVKDLAIVLGSYERSNMPALPHAKDETTALTAECSQDPARFPRVTSVSATADMVIDLLNGVLPNGGSTLAPEMVHFACHGEVLGTGIAKRSVLYLDDGSPLQETLFVSSKLGRSAHSFLFMNACQVGVGGEELGQYAGFAGFAIGAGFSGFIGPLWSVNDEVAKRIAVDFYRHCFGTSGKTARPVADVLADMRSQYLSEPDIKKRQATWLAYVHYGHPHFTLTHAH